MLTISQEQLNFIREAKAWFIKNPGHITYTTGEIKSGEFFAVNYPGEERLLIFTISEFSPVLQIILD